MKRILSLLIHITIICAASCNVESKRKVLVMGRGNLLVDDTTLTMKTGAGHAEKEFDLPPSWTHLNVNTSNGKQHIEIPPEPGYYLLNLKTDTIVGSYQELGKDLSSRHVVTQEELKTRIDSMEAMTKGDNIDYLSNYFCLPGQFMKVSANKSAFIFGPYKNVANRFESDGDFSNLEIYKFYTNTELRTLISNYKEMSMFYKNGKLVKNN